GLQMLPEGVQILRSGIPAAHADDRNGLVCMCDLLDFPLREPACSWNAFWRERRRHVLSGGTEPHPRPAPARIVFKKIGRQFPEALTFEKQCLRDFSKDPRQFVIQASDDYGIETVGFQWLQRIDAIEGNLGDGAKQGF